MRDQGVPAYSDIPGTSRGVVSHETPPHYVVPAYSDISKRPVSPDYVFRTVGANPDFYEVVVILQTDGLAGDSTPLEILVFVLVSNAITVVFFAGPWTGSSHCRSLINIFEI